MTDNYRVLAETAETKAKIASLIRKASHLTGFLPDEIEATRTKVPLDILKDEVEGWVPLHVVVRLLKYRETVADLAMLGDQLELEPDLRAELVKRIHARRTSQPTKGRKSA